jgi:hypothetical protein
MLSKGSLAATDEVQNVLKAISESVDEANKEGNSSISECIRKA